MTQYFSGDSGASSVDINTVGTTKIVDGAVTATKLAVGAARSNFGAGAVLQVLSTTKTDTFSTTSSSFTDITGLSVSITPSSATSKIFVIVSLCGAVAGSANTVQYRLARGSTGIAVGDAAGVRTQSTSGLTYQADSNRLDSYTFQTLDSPATTSAITYKAQMICPSGIIGYIGRTAADTNAVDWPRTASTITVMEIAA